MIVTEETPRDLKPLAEIAKELNIPYSTLQSWRRAGHIRTWRRGVRETLASVEQVRRFALEPRPDEPTG